MDAEGSENPFRFHKGRQEVKGDEVYSLWRKSMAGIYYLLLPLRRVIRIHGLDLVLPKCGAN